LARKYHPDINPGDREAEAFFRQVTEAYETLSDPGRRQDYNLHGIRVRAAASDRVEFEGFDFSASVSSATASTFGDLFADVIRQRATGQPGEAPEPGVDLHTTIALTFEEAMLGAQKLVTLTRLETCASCEGAGSRGTAEARCVHCHGAGTTRWTRGHMVFSKTCAHCGGSGRQRHRPCSSCRAEGVVARVETLTIQVPAGVNEGSRIRVPSKGNAGRRGGTPGALYITTRVEGHRLFQREGDDLHLVVPIAIHEAALGAKIEVPTVDGAARLRVPPGTQSGQRFRLHERGVPSPKTGRRGDLVVEVRLVMPRVIDERSKELLREFGRINDEDVRKDLRGD
jgi:molecular chaperone DnaJ